MSVNVSFHGFQRKFSGRPPPAAHPVADLTNVAVRLVTEQLSSRSWQALKTAKRRGSVGFSSSGSQNPAPNERLCVCLVNKQLDLTLCFFLVIFFFFRSVEKNVQTFTAAETNLCSTSTLC